MPKKSETRMLLNLLWPMSSRVKQWTNFLIYIRIMRTHAHDATI